MTDRNMTEKVIIGYQVSAVIIGSSTLYQLEGHSVAKIWCECRQRVVNTVKPKKNCFNNK